MKIETLIRPNILALKPYSSARSEFKDSADVWLDANENPNGPWNRYPDPLQGKLKAELTKHKPVVENQIFIGNGSDEAIDLLFRLFCRPGIDRMIQLTPTYGMYEVSAGINDVEVINWNLDADFQPILEGLDPYLTDERNKLLFICSPNNPTGNTIAKDRITYLLENFQGIVIVDEAYIDFSTDQSWLNVMNDFDNLVVLQTLSKAYGLASARIGMAFANTDIIQWMNQIKPPYNVSGPTQELAIERVKNFDESQIKTIIEQRELVDLFLKNCPCIEAVFPSEANFILVEAQNGLALYQYLINAGIVVRRRDQISKNALRITIGNQDENEKLMNTIKNFQDEKSIVYR
jgi:histidinol-phosphate aminotransferase